MLKRRITTNDGMQHFVIAWWGEPSEIGVSKHCVGKVGMSLSVAQKSAVEVEQGASTESRFDALQDGWTIFAPKRSERPEQLSEVAEVTESGLDCPFCAGKEAETPQPTWVGSVDPNSPNGLRIDQQPQEHRESSADGTFKDVGSTNRWVDDWSVRVVPNKFPAVESVSSFQDRQDQDRLNRSILSGQSGFAVPSLMSSEERPAKHQRQSNHSLFQRAQICGGHEVVIESREHATSFTDLSLLQAELVFLAYRDRLIYYRNQPAVDYVSIFKNNGHRAGASLSHSHSQIVATNQIPYSIERSVFKRRRHRAATGSCLMCDLVREERKVRERIVARDDLTIAFCPFASPLPMMVRVTTLQHQACFEDLDDESIRSVSRMTYRVISWLEKIRPGVAYNYCLHTKPAGIDDASDAFHWSIDIFPRISQIAGFECSSGCMINPVLPEVAAQQYRRQAASEDPRFAI